MYPLKCLLGAHIWTFLRDIQPSRTNKFIVIKIGFMVLKRIAFNSRIQCKKLKFNRSTQSQDMNKNIWKFGGLVCFAKISLFLAYFLALGWPIQFYFCALNPWVEYASFRGYIKKTKVIYPCEIPIFRYTRKYFFIFFIFSPPWHVRPTLPGSSLLHSQAPPAFLTHSYLTPKPHHKENPDQLSLGTPDFPQWKTLSKV